MNEKEYILKEAHWLTIKEKKSYVTVLPWGATEAHNYHLPYGTDIIEAERIAINAARIATEKEADIMVLPSIPYGVQTGQLDIRYDINMNPSTLFVILKDIIASLRRQKLYKFVLLNGHGGNEFKPYFRELQTLFPEMFLSLINWYAMKEVHDVFDNPGDHAAEMETSLMMHLAPELVLDLSLAGDGKTYDFKLKGLKEKWVWTQREWNKTTRDTGAGNPKNASADKGKILFEKLSQKISEYLIELSEAKINSLYESE